MQSVSAAFTAEEKDSVRKIAESLQISWHRYNLLANRTFTIGVSSIGGNDLIGINPGAVGSPGNYKYFDETPYVLSMGWERGYSMPLGGLTKALAEAVIDNTSGRFTPRYMGGNSELYTAILPSRPMIINAGFNYGGIDQTLPQFAGMISEQPLIDIRNKSLSIKGADYIDYFQNKSLDQAVIFTAQRTDQVMVTLSSQLGMNTAQYDYDTGINVIPFGYFPVGTKFADAFGQLAEAENGHYYQDESGIFKFENRQHWNSSPYTNVQKIITTAMVINAESPNQDHLINVVEVNSKAYEKQPEQIIYRLNPFDSILVPANSSKDVFFNFDDPVLSLTTPTSSGTASFFSANTISDASGTDISSSVTVSHVDRFAQSAKLTFVNTSNLDAYLTNLVITGRTAKAVSQIYTRAVAGHSITAYNEQVVQIDNPFIQSQDWAESYAQMILSDYSSIENLQRITIRAIPELQLGDLISWQGRYWRIYDIKSTLDPAVGFIQELQLLQRNVVNYFRIGVSSIGGTDQIAP